MRHRSYLAKLKSSYPNCSQMPLSHRGSRKFDSRFGARSTPSLKKAKVTNASAMLPRKNCAAGFQKFLVWLRIIRRLSRVSPTNRIRTFWSTIGNSFKNGKSADARRSRDPRRPGLPKYVVGHSRRFCHVRRMSAFPPIATRKRTHCWPPGRC